MNISNTLHLHLKSLGLYFDYISDFKLFLLLSYCGTYLFLLWIKISEESIFEPYHVVMIKAGPICHISVGNWAMVKLEYSGKTLYIWGPYFSCWNRLPVFIKRTRLNSRSWDIYFFIMMISWKALESLAYIKKIF